MPDVSVAPIARVEASPRAESRLLGASTSLAIATASGVALVLGLIWP